MAWIAPITGHCDCQGNARCVECHQNSERASDFAIVADNSAFHGEHCESCGTPFPVKRGDDWQPVWAEG